MKSVEILKVDEITHIFLTNKMTTSYLNKIIAPKNHPLHLKSIAEEKKNPARGQVASKPSFSIRRAVSFRKQQSMRIASTETTVQFDRKKWPASHLDVEPKIGGYILPPNHPF